MVSVVEATLDDPRQVLVAQEKQARGEAVAAMKAEGMEYDERMALLEDVTYPRPLAELIEADVQASTAAPTRGWPTTPRRPSPWCATWPSTA